MTFIGNYSSQKIDIIGFLRSEKSPNGPKKRYERCSIRIDDMDHG